MFEDRHCLGPDCVNAALPNSKYCSKKCGMNMAERRIFEFLPENLAEWQDIKSAADINDENHIRKVNAKIDEIEKEMVKLEAKELKITDLVNKAAELTVSETEANIQDDYGDDTGSIQCMMCTSELNAKSGILRHFEKCFSKHETKSAFGSRVQSQMTGMFCDVFDPRSGIHCKRLKSICPEHSNDIQISDKAVCGRPLIDEILDSNDNDYEICMRPKISCQRHHRWDKLMLGEIMLIKMRLWLKIESLSEEREHRKTAMSRRASLLGILLHKNVYHPAKEDKQPH